MIGVIFAGSKNNIRNVNTMKYFNVKDEFGMYLGGGLRSTGANSGQEFWEDYLSPLLDPHEMIEIDFRGIVTFSVSFLRESFKNVDLSRVKIIFDDEFDYLHSMVLNLKQKGE